MAGATTASSPPRWCKTANDGELLLNSRFPGVGVVVKRSADKSVVVTVVAERLRAKPGFEQFLPKHKSAKVLRDRP